MLKQAPRCRQRHTLPVISPLITLMLSLPQLICLHPYFQIGADRWLCGVSPRTAKLITSDHAPTEAALFESMQLRSRGNETAKYLLSKYRPQNITRAVLFPIIHGILAVICSEYCCCYGNKNMTFILDISLICHYFLTTIRCLLVFTGSPGQVENKTWEWKRVMWSSDSESGVNSETRTVFLT